ncbi:MAG: YfhO family protein [Bacillus sp. (in: firmicutes)]
MNRNQWLLVVAGSVAVALMAHAFFLFELKNGQFMVGPNDGMAQMLPFKSFLYEQFKNGEFFYSFQFGLGGGTYSQLAYYFSTNIFFYLTCFFVYGGEAAGLLPNVDVVFWAQAAVYVNAARLAIILMISTYVFHYMKLKLPYAFTGAVLYGASVMYFRHASYWEFFADAFMWLPLLVLGIEKLLREKQPFWLILAMVLTMFNNFYFAYMNFVFLGIYVILRWIIRMPEDQLTFRGQIRYYVPIGISSFLISAISFIPAVYGYLQNYRPDFEDEIVLFDLQDNVFFTSRLLIIPAVFVLLVFMKRLYKQRLFVLFTGIALLFVVFHYSPLMGSVFNGFSAPQFRFEYMASFAMAGAVAAGLSYLQTVPKREMLFAVCMTAVSFLVWYRFDDLTFGDSNQVALLLIWTVVVLVIASAAMRFPKRVAAALLLTAVVFQIGLANVYEQRLFEDGGLHKSNLSFMESDEYNAQSQRKLVQAALDDSEGPLSRIEWAAGGRNNTPLIQGFNGNSVYSSILNDQLLFLYYDDLAIDMGMESVSRYATFGDRANLYSLWQGTYKIVEKDSEDAVPYGFEPIKENESYILYKNENVLPFARATSDVFSEDELADAGPLTREHAMLNGVVSQDTSDHRKPLSEPVDLIGQAEIRAVGGTYANGTLTVTDDTGGIDIVLGERDEKAVDDYLSFYLRNQSKAAKLYSLDVNEYHTNRKSLQSIYRTEVDDITIRVRSSSVISLRVPKGSYTLKDMALVSESYDTLAEAIRRDQQKDMDVELGSRSVDISYINKDNDTHLVLPIPFEKGWSVEVNGVSKPVEQLNYAFLGVKLEEGENEISFSYLPPYFMLSVLLTLLGLVLVLLWSIFRRK